MKSLRALFVSLLLVPFIPWTASAHHSSAIFDKEREVEVAGTVTAFKWANPHVYIEIESEAGGGVTWLVEGMAPGAMRGTGWTRDSLSPGDSVRVTGNPHRNPQRTSVLGTSVQKTDGTVLRIGNLGDFIKRNPADLPKPAAAESLTGLWATRVDPRALSAFFDPAQSWTLTEKGVAAMASFEDSMDPAVHCIPEPIPYAMIFPAIKNIEIGEEITTIQDMIGYERQIFMNVESHEGAPFSVMGHSIGRWEGDILVVDTRNFSDHRRGLGFRGLASGPKKHLVERFELRADGTAIDYSYRLTDPDYLAEPVTGTLELTHTPDAQFIMEPCDLESAGRYLTE